MKITTKKIAIYSIVAALYTVLSLSVGNFSFGPIQVRLGEVLMIFCLYDKKYIYPLTIGCLITNALGTALGLTMWPDIIFGTFATFIACYLMILTKDIKIKGFPLVALLMPVLANGLIVGAELAYMYGMDNYLLNFVIFGAEVALGELISVVLVGGLLYKPIGSVNRQFEINKI